MGKRRKSRESALQNLYSWDLIGETPTDLFYFSDKIPGSNHVFEGWRTYAQKLFEGVVEHRDYLDELISKYSKHWRLDRMATVDRCILRQAVYELLHCPDVPKAVVINEAVEIAKMYGESDSPIFINGNLDQICKKEIAS